MPRRGLRKPPAEPVVVTFVLEGLISYLVSRIRIGFDPKHRTPEEILKGVTINDQN